MVDPIGMKQARDAYVSGAARTQGARRSDAAARRAATQPAGEEGSVQLSDGLRTIQHAIESVKQAPDVRAERVSALRKQIAAGDYTVSSRQVAAKMLGLADAGL